MTVHEEPDFEVLNGVFGDNKAACLTMGCEPIWVLEQATDDDLEANISAVDASDVFQPAIQERKSS